MLYSPTDVARQFLWKLTPFIYILSTYAYDSWAVYAVFRMVVTSDFLKDHLVYFDAPSKLITFVHSVINSNTYSLFLYQGLIESGNAILIHSQIDVIFFFLISCNKKFTTCHTRGGIYWTPVPLSYGNSGDQ